MSSWSRIARRIRVPLGFAFAVVYVWLARPAFISIVIGATVAFAGLIVRALASGHVQKNEVLATTGPYAYTRNPLYLGSIVMACGFLIAARSWWIALIAVVILLAIYLPVIRSEEAFLHSRFPEYEEYSRRVPRLLPRFRSNPSSTGSFSRHLYWKHREYNAALGTICMIAILVVKLIWFTK
ncbi:MAG TPA: isoprenylcysteine carboxylmethyltransferase family protein [Terriglobales bacterium]|nr:isoprenylcysteine carboxylmethyltransferase family protein [Terriglobales bacterium]